MQLLRKILFPFSFLYALVIYIRNWFFDVGIFTSKTYKTPVICIGNLSAGGTGKTPMVETIVSILKDHYQVAVLSRGYGRKSKGFVIANEHSTVEELGDEPYQVWSKFPEITFVVDADRQNGIEYIEDKKLSDVILLDDGFQHRKVQPGFSVLLTAYNNLYTNDWYLPTGDLRDSKKEAKRANIIIVTKCPEDLSLAEQNEIVKSLQVATNQMVFFTYIGYNKVVDSAATIIPLKSLKNKKITLVTGIANPKPLEDYLHKNEISFQHLKYKDHHFFTDEEISLMASKDCILTTEKDYVRLKNRLSNLIYISVEHSFVNNGKTDFEKEIKAYLASLKN